MLSDEIKIKYIGGPTALFETGGLRFLTDPTFDPKGSDYKTNIYTLHKITDPSMDVEHIGKIDFVLLSHDHHFDNLDNEGRKFLSHVDKVYTTQAGAERLGGNAIGLTHWQTVEVPTKDGRMLTITGTPCRHGPAGGDRGPVTGFVLNYKNENKGAVYISGDTVLYEGVEEVIKRSDIKIAVLFMGAAKVKEVGPHLLTMTTDEAIAFAQKFKNIKIVPLHFEGWAHFSESRSVIENKFKEVGLTDRLKWARTS